VCGASSILFGFVGGWSGDLSVNFMLVTSECHSLSHQCNPFPSFIFPNLDTKCVVPVCELRLEVSKNVKQKDVQ
jgi:hypothetical protein